MEDVWNNQNTSYINWTRKDIGHEGGQDPSGHTTDTVEKELAGRTAILEMLTQAFMVEWVDVISK